MILVQKCFLLFIAFCLTGCTTAQIQKSKDEARSIMTSRFYSGPPREPNNVSLIIKGWGLVFPSSLDGLTIERSYWKGFSYHGYPRILEVLPGQHVIDIGFYSSQTIGGTTSTSTANATLNVDVKPGRVYVYYGEFPTKDTWRPVFVDLNELKNRSNYVSRLKESVSKYFRGKRPVYTGLTQKQ